MALTLDCVESVGRAAISGLRVLGISLFLLACCSGGFCVVRGQAPASPASAYLPQVANGEFAGGRFRTTFVLTNTTTVPIEAQIDLTRDDASPLVVTLTDGDADLGTDSSFTVIVPGAGTRFLDTDGLGEGSVGAARIESAGPLTVAAVFAIIDSTGNLVTEGGVGDSQPLGSFVLPIDKTGSFNTGLALFNPDPSQSSQLTLRLYDLTGQAKNNPVQLTLNGLQHRAQFVDEIFSGLGDFRGTLHVSADRPVAAMTLRQNFQPLGLTTLPVFSTSSTQIEFNLPHIADGSFSGGRIRTSFLLFTLSGAGASAKLTLTQDDGQPLEMSIGSQGAKSDFDLSIGPNGSVFLESSGADALRAGAAHVASDQPIGVAAIFSILDTDGRLRTEAGVAAARRLANLTLPFGTAPSFDSGIAFFNLQDSETTVILALLDPDGESASGEASQKTIKLTPHGHAASFVTELFPGTTQPFRGSVGILASAEISAVTLRQNTTPLSFTTLPVAENAARPIRGDGLLLNEVGFIPPAGQFPYVELKATRDGAWPAGLSLYNEADQEYRLPASLPALPEGEFLLILFDGLNQVEGSVVHADRTGFLNRASGLLLLVNPNGQEIDHVGWGFEQAGSVSLGSGGVFDDPSEGMSIGRVPNSDRPAWVEDWLSYAPEDKTPGQANPRPKVEVLLPFSGAVSEESVLDLSWYPVVGVTAYRVQIARDLEFSQIVADQTVEAGEFRTPSLAAADYFWRVQAIFADQTGASFSDPAVFTVLAPVPAGARAPAQVGQILQKKLLVELIAQRKDTRMLLLESSHPTGDHAWDKDHAEFDPKDPADEMNCGLAAIAMINSWFQSKIGSSKRLSQDRIGYQIFKDRTPGPEWDLSYKTGLSYRGQSSEQTRALEWALAATSNFKDFTGAEHLWADARSAIDNERPLLAVVGLPGGRGSHTVVVTGYRIVPDGRRFLFINNPWHNSKIKPITLFHLDVPIVSPLLPSTVWLAYCVLNESIHPRSDEDSIRTDSDRDGIVDFDEQERFKTDWQKFPEDGDTDKDEVPDKKDVFASVFDTALLAYVNRSRFRNLQFPVRLNGNRRPDVDSDPLPFELDADSDGGGCYDGFEDYTYDGARQNFETSNYDKWDDRCHVRGEEVRTEKYQLSKTPSSKSDWESRVTARFCVGPLLPRLRTDPAAVAGNASVSWTAHQVTEYSQLTASGCQMPLNVRNDFGTTFLPVDNSGSVGPGPAKGAITVAFYPRPNGKTVTALYNESPPCPFLKDEPVVWPESSAIWGGIGWFGPPFQTRVPVAGGGFHPPSTAYPVPQPGSGQSTLHIWFVTRTERLAAQPCKP